MHNKAEDRAGGRHVNPALAEREEAKVDDRIPASRLLDDPAWLLMVCAEVKLRGERLTPTSVVKAAVMHTDWNVYKCDIAEAKVFVDRLYSEAEVLKVWKDA